MPTQTSWVSVPVRDGLRGPFLDPTAGHRLNPPPWRHDWYALSRLRDAVGQTLDLAAWKRGDRIVDIGAGSEPYRPLLEARGLDYVGCDIGGDAGVRIREDGTIPLESGSAAGVVSFQVLEHVWDIATYLSECHRLLRPGGRLLLSTHGVWPYHPHPTDYRRWTRDGLVRELTTRGFECEQVTPVLGPLATTTQIRSLGMYQVLRHIPILRSTLAPPLMAVMNARMVLEDLITPKSMTDSNASVYVTLSRRLA